MKKIMLIACGLIMASTQQTQAQSGAYLIPAPASEGIYRDTLIINLAEGNKIQLVCSDFKKLKQYTAGDSVKTLFINDLEHARKANTLSTDAQKVYYFVHRTGKRRLKAENPDYTDNAVNPEEEIARLDNGFPKYEYHIYDLERQVQVNVYLQDPEKLKEVLGGFSMNEAIKQISVNQKSELRKSYKLIVDANDEGYTYKSRTKGHFDFIEVLPQFGVGVLGNTIGPIAEYDVSLRLTNKYGVSMYRFGFSGSAFCMVNSTGGEISAVNFVRSYELKAMYNFGGQVFSSSTYLFGVKGGIMRSELKSFNKAYKFGIITEGAGGLTYSFDYIKDSNKNPVYGITILKTF